MKCPYLLSLNFREKYTCGFKISLSMSSKDAPASAADIVQAIAIPDTLFPLRSFCSSAHTFHKATRSHQASSCHRAPSKDDDFRDFSGDVFQMPENTESKKISLLTVTQLEERPMSLLHPVTGKG